MDTKINSLSHFSLNNKRVATEIWTAGWFHFKNVRKHLHLIVRVQPEAYFDTCKEPGRGHRLRQVTQVRGGVYDQEAGFGHPEQ